MAKKQTPMEKLTQGYEKIVKGKEVKTDQKTFNELLSKAAKKKPKQRGLK